MSKKPKVSSDSSPAGRPTIYTEELGTIICKIVASHPYGLPTLCKMFPQLPHRDTINEWRWENKVFSDNYALAKRFQAELMAESIEDVASELKESAFHDDLGMVKIDSGMLGYARLVCDNRKWTAARLAPKIYGDKMQIEQKTEENDKLKAELMALRNKLDEKNKSEY